MYRMYHFYSRAIVTRPIFVNSLTTSSLVGASDFIAQTAFEDSYDFRRTATMAFIGGTVASPGLYVWYLLLESRVGTGLPLLKVFVDQGIFAPVCLPMYVMVVDTMEGKSLEQAKQHVKQEYWTLLKATWSIWPLAQTVNFTFVPYRFRVLYAQVASIFWNTFLSWRIHLHNKLVLTAERDRWITTTRVD